MLRRLSGGMERRVALARSVAIDPISINVIANLIKRQNDALGTTSIVVTYDVSESLKAVDHVYFMSDGKIVAQGPAAEMLESDDPFVRQFVHAEPDGQVRFHYPANPLEEDLGFMVG